MFRRPMMGDEPMPVFGPSPIVILLTRANVLASALHSGVVFFTEVIQPKVRLTKEHGIDIGIGMNRSCVATASTNLDIKHQE